jgi:RimJ/RimL family protein N-acetyltransferase
VGDRGGAQLHLETDRLVLRDLRAEDVESEVSLWTDPHVIALLRSGCEQRSGAVSEQRGQRLL